MEVYNYLFKDVVSSNSRVELVDTKSACECFQSNITKIINYDVCTLIYDSKTGFFPNYIRIGK